MKDAFNRVNLYLSVHLLALVAGLVVILSTEKSDLHLWFNQFHNPFSDIIFKYSTHLAEGLSIGFAVFLVLIYKVRFGVAGLIGIVSSGLITQFLKRVIFSDFKRPSVVFDGIANLHFVEGVRMLKSFSFPSGHSTAAFALFLFIAFVSKDKRIQILCYVFAVITAASRVYLSQHFFEDIYVGSLVGTIVCFFVLALFNKQSWGEKGLLANFEANRGRS